MKLPAKPPVGHLIAYEYLWLSQSGARDDGAKTYPSAVIIAREDIGPVPLAYVLGISHKPPTANERAMEVPAKLARHLGLDDEPMWIYTDQINIFAWPGPDVRPAEHLSTLPSSKDGCTIGALPKDWFDLVKAHLAESYRYQMVRTIKRTT